MFVMLATVGGARGEGLPHPSELDVQGDARWANKQLRLTDSRTNQAGAGVASAEAGRYAAIR
jgi:hypothetical protein